MDNIKLHQELPVGFGVALAQDSEAMRCFAALPEERQQKIIEGTHGIESKAEMRAYVASLHG